VAVILGEAPDDAPAGWCEAPPAEWVPLRGGVAVSSVAVQPAAASTAATATPTTTARRR
jgi:hypothetical protein